MHILLKSHHGSLPQTQSTDIITAKPLVRITPLLMHLWQHISQHISSLTGKSFCAAPKTTIGGGCINSAFKLSDGKKHWFVKTNHAKMLSMFEAELDGLNALADTKTLKVAQALCCGSFSDHSYLVIEYLPLQSGSNEGQALAGEQLSHLHAHTNKHFGWRQNNTIGATAQLNKPNQSWVSFFQNQRLGFQLELAANNGYGKKLQSSGIELIERCPQLINHNPQPALIHGDLWGGNLSFTTAGEPVIYDPAVYFADREAEIAMTELFGGFSPDFYAAYNAQYPLDKGYASRKMLYNLYHILNHLNLFGAGYQAQAQNMIDRLLAECR